MDGLLDEIERREQIGEEFIMASKGKNQHVVPHPEGWAVRSEGSERPSAVKPTQREAIDVATEIARNQKVEVIIHGENGKIRDRSSYGNDPTARKG